METGCGMLIGLGVGMMMHSRRGIGGSSSRLKKSLFVKCGTSRKPGTGGTAADAPVAI